MPITSDLLTIDQGHFSKDLRPASDVMRLSRMGQSFPHRLSFARQIVRRMIADKAQVTRSVWCMNAQGHGRAVYSVVVGGHPYSLVAISSALDDHQRSDRVIAEAWDACFTLFDGIPTNKDLDRLAENQVKQEAGRYSAKELILSRANRSVRLFDYVRDCLASQKQPESKRLNDIGYLMRTTAVYGNGKFGIADRHDFSDRPGMFAPFQAEMLTVWLIREFTHDLVEHCACALNPDAIRLAPALKRHLGIGNATGLGMAPFLISHPMLLHRWVWVREMALSRALQTNDLIPHSMIDRVKRHLDQWDVEDCQGRVEIEKSRQEFSTATECSAQVFWKRAQRLSQHSQELTVALILETTSADIATLSDSMACDSTAFTSLDLSLAEFQQKLPQLTAWAQSINKHVYWFWYVSANKLEPRIGRRDTEEGVELEKPLSIVRDIAILETDVSIALENSSDPHATLLTFLQSYPQHCALVHRLLETQCLDYAEIQDNLLGKSMRPIDMLRFKLSFLGASKFDPKSDLWTRITLFQGAPVRDNLNEPGDDWWLSVI